MAPFPIVDLLVAGLELCFSGAHINQQVQIPLQKLHGKKAAGLCGPEVKRDRARLLGVPLWQRDVGLGGLKSYRIQGCYILTAEHQVTIQGDFRVTLDGQP
uniref:Uncharacterized protein n=1 Tax=Pundamilia nyererei TaxID=303518 RepID=A0A3B4GS80_9CICH